MTLQLNVNHFTFVQMRFLLMIPILALFLSNIPLKVEIMPVAKETLEKCCSKKQRDEMNCKKFHQPKKKLCCESKESSCSFYSCFQVVSPMLTLPKFNFSIPGETHKYCLFKKNNWINPFIKSLFQPPDQFIC